MGAYKTTVAKHIHLSGYLEFKWQQSFHDRIISDERSYENISKYIINNPANWKKDELVMSQIERIENQEKKKGFRKL